MDTRVVGIRLKEERQKKKETREELSNRLGVSVSAIRNYENGIRTPKDEIKFRYAKHFNKKIDDLFF